MISFLLRCIGCPEVECHKANKAQVFRSLTLQDPGNIHLVICFVKFMKTEYLCLHKVLQTISALDSTKPRSAFICIQTYDNFIPILKKTWSYQSNNKVALSTFVNFFRMFKKPVIPNRYHDLLKWRINSVQQLLTLGLQFLPPGIEESTCLAPSLHATLCSNIISWRIYSKYGF